jgi:hypothetical protein
MRKILLLLLATSAAVTFAAPTTGQRRGLIIDADLPRSLQAFCESAELIVEASVQSVFPAEPPLGVDRKIAETVLITDSSLRVMRVLKGQQTETNIVVAQPGGVRDNRSMLTEQVVLMRPGERYILFLRKPSVQESSFAVNRPGLKRYLLVNYAGSVLLDGQIARLHRDLPFERTYANKTPFEVLSEIEEIVRMAQGSK